MKIFKDTKMFFVPSADGAAEINNYSANLKKSSLAFKTKKIKQFFDVKRRTLGSFFDIILNYN